MLMKSGKIADRETEVNRGRLARFAAMPVPVPQMREALGLERGLLVRAQT